MCIYEIIPYTCVYVMNKITGRSVSIKSVL